MKKHILSIGLLICYSSAWGQEIDTVLTGTLYDTIIARHFFHLSEKYLSESNLEEAYNMALRSQTIFRSVCGKESVGNADATYLMGHIRLDQKKFSLAKIYLLDCLNLYINIFGEKSTFSANTSEILGVCYWELNLDSAIYFIEKSLKIRVQIFDKSDVQLALSYFHLGGAYQSAGDFENALKQYERCKEIGHENPAAELSGVYFNLGLIYTSKHEYAKAREHFLIGLKISLSSNNLMDLTKLYMNLSYLETETNNCDSAIQYCLLGLKAIENDKNTKDLMEGQIYHALGNANLCRGDFVNAEANFNKSYYQLRKVLGNEHPFLTIPLNSLATTNATGPVHAAEYLLLALDIFQKTDLADDYYITCSNLSENYAAQKELDKAIKYAEIALDGFLKNPDGRQHEIGVVWNNLGNYYKTKQGFDKSLNCFNKAEQAFLQLYSYPHEVFATTYLNFADNYFRQNQLEKADSFLNLSISTLRKTSPNDRITNAIYCIWAEIASKKQNFSLALTKVDSAILASSNRLGNFNEGLSEAFVKSNLLKGQICLNYYQKSPNVSILNNAKLAFKKAENTFQFCLNSAMRESDKIQLLEYAPLIAEGIIRTSLANSGNSKSAFQYSENSKSGLLRTAIQDAYAKKMTNVPDSLLSKEYALKVNLAFYEKLEYECLKNDTTQVNLKLIDIRRQIFDIHQQYDQLIQYLETVYPEYYRAKYDLHTETVETVQRDLLQPGQTMLEYFTGDSSIFIFVVRKDLYEVVEVPRDFPLEEWIKSMHSGITDWWAKKSPEDQYSASLSWYGQAASKLYQKLIAPILKFIPANDEIIIIPDGVLAYIPFEALLTAPPPADLTRFQDYKYWVLDHDISYCYSATLFREMCDRRHRMEPKYEFLGIAPTFAGTITPIPSSNLDFAGRFGHDSLEYNVVEIDSIQHIWGGQIFTGHDATEKCFADTAWAFRIIHAALHGEANDRSGDNSFLAFYETSDSIENEWLYVREVYNLTLNADLVTLSACQTGLGELRRGEGIIGLTRAFTYAGAKSIVNTLWSVDDKRTMLLMTQFYHNLKAGQQKDAALGNAKRNFIRKGELWAHPVFWAGFIGIGDMRAID